MLGYDAGASGSLVGEYDGAGNLMQETVWLGDIPVATLRPNGSGGVDLASEHSSGARSIDNADTSGQAFRPRWFSHTSRRLKQERRYHRSVLTRMSLSMGIIAT